MPLNLQQCINPICHIPNPQTAQKLTSEAKVKCHFLESLEAGEIMLEVAEDAGMDFAERSLDGDFADVGKPGAYGLHVLEVWDLDELRLVFAAVKFGVESVLSARPLLLARYVGLWEGQGLTGSGF